SGACKAGTRQPVVRNPLACDVHVLLVVIGHDDRPLQAERDPGAPRPPWSVPQPVMAETVRLYRAEVEQFRIVCYRTKGVFPPDNHSELRRDIQSQEGRTFATASPTAAIVALHSSVEAGEFVREAKTITASRFRGQKRLADGAVQADLARSYGVSEATISRLAAASPFEHGAVGL